MVPTTQPISRSPVYIMWTGNDWFYHWKEYCNGSISTCTSTQAAKEGFDELAEDAPVFAGGGGSVGVVPLVYGYGPMRGSPGGIVGNTDTTIYGYGQQAGPSAPGFATVDQILQRKADLATYLGQLPTQLAPYNELGSQLFGHPDSPATGIFEFLSLSGGSNAPDFIAAGLMKPVMADKTWLKRSWNENADCYPGSGIPSLQGYYCDWFPKQVSAVPSLPVYRLSADILNPGYRDWKRQTIVQQAAAGEHRIYMDNSFFGRCWNDDCEQGFEGFMTSELARTDRKYDLQPWLAAADAERLYSPPPASLIEYGEFEDWYFSWLPPFDPNPLPPNVWPNGGHTIAGSVSISPDIHAYKGFYSGRLDIAQDGSMFTVNTVPLAGVPHTFNVHYRTTNNTPIVVHLFMNNQANPTGTFTEYPLLPSTDWATGVIQFTPLPGPGTGLALWLEFPHAGTVWLDDLVLQADGQVQPQPPYHGWLGYGQPGGYNWGSVVRADYTNRYWGSLVEPLLGELHDAPLPTYPAMNIIVGSGGQQQRNSDWFTMEKAPDEAMRLMAERSWNPGRYAPGTTFPGSPGNPGDPDFVPSKDCPGNLATFAGCTPDNHYIVANGFDYLAAQNTRLPDAFAYFTHLMQGHFPRADDPARLANMHNQDTVKLMLAEGAAYTGGSGIDPGLGITGAYGDPGDPYRVALRATMNEFFKSFVPANPDAYHCVVESADVAVVLRSETVTFRQEQARLFDSLSAAGMMVDVLGLTQITPEQLASHKVVVLHHVHRLSEAEAGALRAFAAGGGAVLMTADTGRLDEHGLLRIAYPVAADGSRASWWWDLSPYLSATPPASHLWAKAGVTTSDVQAALATYQGWASANAFSVPDSRLRITRWSAYDRTVVHILNYGVDRGHGVSTPGTMALTVTVALPAGMPPPTTVYLSAPEPGQETPVLSATPVTATADGRYQFSVPSHHIYTVAVLR
jgi:hypothetical protein